MSCVVQERRGQRSKQAGSKRQKVHLHQTRLQDLSPRPVTCQQMPRQRFYRANDRYSDHRFAPTVSKESPRGIANIVCYMLSKIHKNSFHAFHSHWLHCTYLYCSRSLVRPACRCRMQRQHAMPAFVNSIGQCIAPHASRGANV